MQCDECVNGMKIYYHSNYYRYNFVNILNNFTVFVQEVDSKLSFCSLLIFLKFNIPSGNQILIFVNIFKRAVEICMGFSMTFFNCADVLLMARLSVT